MIRKLRFLVDRHTLEKLYMSFVRPILEYGYVIYDCQNQSLISKLENVQLEAVSGRTKFISLDRLYDEMGEIVKKEGKSQVDFIS